MSVIENLDINLRGKTSELDAGLDKAAKRVKQFGTQVDGAAGGIASKMSGIGATIGGAFSGLNAAIPGWVKGLLAVAFAAKTIGDQASEVKQIAREASILGLSFNTLAGASAFAGVEAETLGHGLQHMLRSINEAGNGSQEMAGQFRRMGVDFQALQGLKPEQQLDRIADALKALPDAGSRVSAAMKIFGRSGAELIPFLTKGSEGMAELRQKAEDLGLTLSTDQVDAIRKSSLAWKEMKAAVTGIARQLTVVFSPAWELGAKVVGAAFKWIVGAVKASLPTVEQFWTTVKAGLAFVGELAGMLGSALGSMFQSIGQALGINGNAFKGWGDVVRFALIAIEFAFKNWQRSLDIVFMTIALRLTRFWEDLKHTGAIVAELVRGTLNMDFSKLRGMGTREKSDLELSLEQRLRVASRLLGLNFEQFLREKMQVFEKKAEDITAKQEADLKGKTELKAAERGSAEAFHIINDSQGDKMFNAINDQLKENRKANALLQRIAQALANGKPIVVGKI